MEAPPLVLGNTVYAGSLEGILYAIDAITGTLKWRYATDGQISGSCNWINTPDQKSIWLLVGSYDFRLHCIDALTGKAELPTSNLMDF